MSSVADLYTQANSAVNVRAPCRRPSAGTHLANSRLLEVASVAPPVGHRGHNRHVLRRSLGSGPGDGESRVHLVGRDIRPDLLDARARVCVGDNNGRSGDPNGGKLLAERPGESFVPILKVRGDVRRPPKRKH